MIVLTNNCVCRQGF